MFDTGSVTGFTDTVTESAQLFEPALSVHEVIHRYHKQLLIWLGRRLSNHDDAYDVAQESYIKLLKYEGASDVRSSWAILQMIAYNTASDLGRTRKARLQDKHCSLDDIELDANLPTLERVMQAKQELDAVIRAIESLPVKCKQVFLLSRLDDLSYRQIALRCDISIKMVEKHISHALQVCKQSLE